MNTAAVDGCPGCALLSSKGVHLGGPGREEHCPELDSAAALTENSTASRKNGCYVLQKTRLEKMKDAHTHPAASLYPDGQIWGNLNIRRLIYQNSQVHKRSQ